MSVLKFYPKDAAKDPNAVLEQAINNYDSVVILGWNKDGLLDLRASTNLTHAEINWLLSIVQNKLVSGDYSTL